MDDTAIHDDALKEIRDSANKISVAYIASRLRIIEMEHEQKLAKMTDRISVLDRENEQLRKWQDKMQKYLRGKFPEDAK